MRTATPYKIVYINAHYFLFTDMSEVAEPWKKSLFRIEWNVVGALVRVFY